MTEAAVAAWVLADSDFIRKGVSGPSALSGLGLRFREASLNMENKTPQDLIPCKRPCWLSGQSSPDTFLFYFILGQ